MGNLSLKSRKESEAMTRNGKAADKSADYLETIGTRVRATRARRGMSRKILAQDSGVSERYLGQLEAGQGNISISLLRQVADAMSVSVGELLRDEPDTPFEQKMILQLLERLSPHEVEDVHRLLIERYASAADENRATRVALLGLRGAGKSTLGRRLADRLKVAFIDTAEEIETLSGMTLSEIFSLYGQRAYRRFEHQAIENVLARHREAVIETGGSVVSEPASLALILECCTSVWVKTSPEEHIARVIAQGDKRMLAGPDHEVMEDLKRILAEREPLYARADYEIDTTGQTVDASLAALVARLPEVRTG
jgi:XRE family aerobic/anaerobic benzoate catabolism transcriptional regulator